MVFDIYFSDYIKRINDMRVERWNYHWGCVLIGAVDLYQATGKEEYREAVIHFGETYVDDNGKIAGFCEEEQNVDLMASGRLLYFLYDETGEKKYLSGILYIMKVLEQQPRTSFGNFWHKRIYPGQVWLDGLYMVQPFYMEYGKRFGREEIRKDSLKQFENVRRYLYDKKKRLYYHGYDETRTRIWADKENGCSPSFWVRSIGWYLMALCDCYEISEDSETKNTLGTLLREAIEGLMVYQDKATGLFYQLVDRKDLSGNYLETSGSAMISYALLKGSRLGILEKEKYNKEGAMILAAIEAEKMKVENSRLVLTGTCASAGLGPNEERDGSPEYYLSEAVKDDNAHGVAACMMAYSEWLKSELPSININS